MEAKSVFRRTKQVTQGSRRQRAFDLLIGVMEISNVLSKQVSRQTGRQAGRLASKVSQSVSQSETVVLRRWGV